LTETYEILILKYGEMADRFRRDNYVMDDSHDVADPIDYFVWVVRNENRTVMIDTGFDHREAKARGRELIAEPRDVLRDIGIDAEAIETLVVSHLHYDHAGTLGHFPNAHFHLQEAEMAYATGRCMCDMALQKPFTADHVCEMVKSVYSGRVQFHNGDGHVAPGITVHHTPGHSKGMQSVRVMTAGGPVVLAVDTAHFYETFEQRRPFPIVHNMEDVLRSYDTLRDLADGDLRSIVPGHDPLILKRYPAWKPETQGIVHRLDVGRID